MKKKGFFLLEELMILTIFSIFLKISFPLIKNTLRIKKHVEKEIKYNRNFIYTIENILKESENCDEIKILDDGEKLLVRKKIYEDNIPKNLKIYYYFYGSFLGKRFVRKVFIDKHFSKNDILFDNVTGNFFEEDNFIKLKIKYDRNKEEEYIWK